MNLQQLRMLCEVVNRGLSISGAAAALGRTQPSVTRQIQELERELGLEVFSSNRSRILTVTPAGKQIIAIARGIIRDVGAISDVAADLKNENEGEITIATTHTEARYTLPAVLQQFARARPEVKVRLQQGYPAQCEEAVASGKADLAIYTEVEVPHPNVVFIPLMRLRRSIITPPRHPLLRQQPLTLEAIARYPIITYNEAFSGQRVVDQAFQATGLQANIVMSAFDADASKAYVELGLGIAILATITFDEKRDPALRRIDAHHLFASSLLGLAVRRAGYLRRYVLVLISMLAPHLRERDIDKALAGDGLPDRPPPDAEAGAQV
jgi:LysR family cys regulon transcriptional activator